MGAFVFTWLGFSLHHYPEREQAVVQLPRQIVNPAPAPLPVAKVAVMRANTGVYAQRVAFPRSTCSLAHRRGCRIGVVLTRSAS